MNNDNNFVSINTSVNDKDQLKNNSFKNILFIITLLILFIGGGFITLKIFFNKNNITLEGPGSETTTTSVFLEAFCNKTNLTKFLQHFDLTEDNISLVTTSYKENIVYKKYNLVYNGFIITDQLYVIMFDNDKIICSNGSDLNSKFLTRVELESKYNSLDSKVLRSFLKYSIYDKFSTLNKMKSIVDLTDFYKRLNLSQSEIDEEILNINEYYDSYVTNIADNNKIVYGKNTIIKSIKSAYNIEIEQ